MRFEINAAVLLSVLQFLTPAPSLADADAVDYTPQSVTFFDANQFQLPESVTMDEAGNFYFSMANTIQKLTPDGQLSQFAELPIPQSSFALGVKFGPDGYLYAGSGSFDPADNASYVFRIDGTGEATPLAHLDRNGFPNDLAFDGEGNTYVTDPFNGQIWKIDPNGQYVVWLQHPLLEGDHDNPVLVGHWFGADGIAFDKEKSNLYIGNIDSGAIIRIPVLPNGEAGTPNVWVQDDRLKGNDGLAFDKSGNLYVAVNGQDALAVIDQDGHLSMLAQGAPLDGPSSLVFGKKGEDKKTLYIASFAISRALGAQQGTPHPNLSKIEVKIGGLPIP